MKVSQNPPSRSNGLLAGLDRTDPDQVLVAFRLLRARHRSRPDIKAKLLELAERKLGAAT